MDVSIIREYLCCWILDNVVPAEFGYKETPVEELQRPELGYQRLVIPYRDCNAAFNLIFKGSFWNPS
jgi:hypothetical protein